MEEKKRRNGKFNIVDIIIVVILLAGAAFLGMKLLGGGGGDIVGSSTRIRYTVLVPGVNAEVCENVLSMQEAKGQAQLMANGALVDGYVTGIEVAPHLNYEPNAEGEVTISEETGENARVDMTFTIEASVGSTVTYKVGTQEVRVGKTHIVKTTEYEMEGYEDAVILKREVIG